METDKTIKAFTASTPEAEPIGETFPVSAQPLTGLFRADERSLSFSGNALNALSRARTTGIVNAITKDSIAIGDVIITSAKASKLGVGEAKLLRYGVSAFTKENAQNEKKPILRITGDTRDFARANGVKIDPQPMETPKEQAKENRRATKALENFVAKLARNAEALNNASYSWKETVKGKPNTYSGVSIIGAYKIDSSVIMLEFTQSAAEYIVQLPLSDTPRALYAVDDRKPNAYAIAQALITHYSIENNVKRNTERILKVENILSYTSFPTQETLKANRWSWERLVKEPFEEALDELTRKGLFAPEEFDEKTHKRIRGGWRYCLSGMEELSDDQASNILRYEQFASLYICYELSGYDSHSERLKLIVEKGEAQIRKAARTRNK